ncbi:MAG: hypothetical protein IPG91_15830 [Ideonella sp.]|nr:hypothetical protein [Ideonella sp.]
MCALLAGVPLYLRTQGIFACPATSDAAQAFVADCNASAYGDYDHGAFWYDLEPDATRSAAEADVLFLGSSRLQFGLSTGATAEWFERHAIRYFLFGFSDTETVVYSTPLLERLRPRAKVVVINADRFFDDRISRPASEILGDETRTGWRYRLKRAWQALHRGVCTALPRLCGNNTVIYRSRADGSWQMNGAAFQRPMPVSDGPATDLERWNSFAGLANTFVSGLGVPRECVLLTIVPTVQTKRAEAKAIAEASGLTFIAPTLPGLTTFDGSHLDAASAERWSAAFLAAAGPKMHDCLARV